MNSPDPEPRHLRVYALLSRAHGELRGRSDPEYRLVSKHGSDWPALALRLVEEDLEYERLVDSAARALAETGSAPLLLLPAVRFLLSTRLHAAGELLESIYPMAGDRSAFQDLRSDWSDAQLLSWLLVDQWRKRRALWLKLCAIAHAGPFEFADYAPLEDSPRKR